MEGSPNKTFVRVVGESGDILDFAPSHLTAGEVLGIVCSSFGFDLSCMGLQFYDPANNGVIVNDMIIPLERVLCEDDVVQLINVKNNLTARHLMTQKNAIDHRFSVKKTGRADTPLAGKFWSTTKNSNKNDNNDFHFCTIVHEGQEHVFPFPQGVKEMNKYLVCVKFCSANGLDHNCYNLDTTLETGLCHDREIVKLIKQENTLLKNVTKKEDPLKPMKKPILVQTQENPMIFVGVPMYPFDEKGEQESKFYTVTYLQHDHVLKYVCKVCDYDYKDYMLKLYDSERPVPKKISENTRLRLVKR